MTSSKLESFVPQQGGFSLFLEKKTTTAVTSNILGTFLLKILKPFVLTDIKRVDLHKLYITLKRHDVIWTHKYFPIEIIFSAQTLVCGLIQ